MYEVRRAGRSNVNAITVKCQQRIQLEVRRCPGHRLCGVDLNRDLNLVWKMALMLVANFILIMRMTDM